MFQALNAIVRMGLPERARVTSELMPKAAVAIDVMELYCISLLDNILQGCF